MFYFIYESLLTFFIWYVLIVSSVNFLSSCRSINLKFGARNSMNQTYSPCKQFLSSKGYRGFIDRESISTGDLDVVSVQNLGHHNKAEGQSKHRNVQKEKPLQEEEVGSHPSPKMPLNFFHMTSP